jgi:hypothetical protein
MSYQDFVLAQTNTTTPRLIHSMDAESIGGAGLMANYFPSGATGYVASGGQTATNTTIKKHGAGSYYYHEGSRESRYFDLRSGLSALWIEFWIYIPEVNNPTTQNIIVIDNSTTSTRSTNANYITLNGNRTIGWSTVSNGGAGGGNFSSSGVIPVATWTHVAVVYNGNSSTKTIYINGGFSGSQGSGSTVDRSLHGKLHLPDAPIHQRFYMDGLVAYSEVFPTKWDSIGQPNHPLYGLSARVNYTDIVITNVSITETPATATALMTDETVSTTSNINHENDLLIASNSEFIDPVITAGVSIEIQETPATASADAVNPNVLGESTPNVSVVVGLLEISAEFPEAISSIDIAVGISVIAFSLEENVEPFIFTGDGYETLQDPATAFAYLVEPPFGGAPDVTIYQEGSMTANGIVVDGIPTYNANYRNLVKQSGPSLYMGSYVQNKWSALSPGNPQADGVNEYRDFPEEYYDLKAQDGLFSVWQNDGYDNWGLPEYVNTYDGNSDGFAVVPSGFPMTAIGDGVSFDGPEFRFLDKPYTNFQPYNFADEQARYFGNDYNNWTFETWFKPQGANAAVSFDIGQVTKVTLNANSQLEASLRLKDRNGIDTLLLSAANFGAEGNNYGVIVDPPERDPARFKLDVLVYDTRNTQLAWTQLRSYEELSMEPNDLRFAITAINSGLPAMYYNTVTNTWRTRPRFSSDSLYSAQPNEIFYGSLAAVGEVRAQNLGSSSGSLTKSPATSLGDYLLFTGGMTGTLPHATLQMVGDNVFGDAFGGTYTHSFTKKQGSTQNNESPYNFNAWNHFAVTVEYGNFGGGRNIRTTLWINGVLYQIQTGKYRNSDTSAEGLRFSAKWGSDTVGLTNRNLLLDEIALYKKVLTNSEIINHWEFISTTSPNKIIEPDAFTAIAYFEQPTLFTQGDITFPETPTTASGLFVEPIVAAATDILVLPIVQEITTEFVNPYFYGNPDSSYQAAVMTASSDAPENVYKINTQYQQYLITNHAPHRYINFDVPTGSQDIGSDNDYANASPYTYNGYINLPYQGINNNGLVTPGTGLYSPDFIVKESEYNDEWGTTGTGYHFGFWIKKNVSDTASYNRVIATAQSYLNTNDYIILWQQGDYVKLTVRDSDSSQTTYTASIAANVFDGKRNNIVVNFDYTGSGVCSVYVNKNLVLDASVGSIKPILINGSTSVNADSETNNRSRFSIGASLVPDLETKLSTTLYPSLLEIDDFHWSETQITLEEVSDLWSEMPGRFDSEILADPAIATNGVFVDITVGAGLGVNATPLTAESMSIEPLSIGADRELIYAADSAFLASSLAVEPFEYFGDSINNIVITSDIFSGTIDFAGGSFTYTVSGQPMTASILMQSQSPYFDPYNLLILNQSLTQPTAIISNYYKVGDIDSND